MARHDRVMGRPFRPRMQVTNSDGEEEEITREDQLTRDLVAAWEVSVNQFVQKEARERAVPKRTVRDEFSVPLIAHDLLRQIPRLLARNLVHVEEERIETKRE